MAIASVASIILTIIYTFRIAKKESSLQERIIHFLIVSIITPLSRTLPMAALFDSWANNYLTFVCSEFDTLSGWKLRIILPRYYNFLVLHADSLHNDAQYIPETTEFNISRWSKHKHYE